jgi:hypothetical protein
MVNNFSKFLNEGPPGKEVSRSQNATRISIQRILNHKVPKSPKIAEEIPFNHLKICKSIINES